MCSVYLCVVGVSVLLVCLFDVCGVDVRVCLCVGWVCVRRTCVCVVCGFCGECGAGVCVCVWGLCVCLSVCGCVCVW